MLRLLEVPEGGSIPPQASEKVKKALRDKDYSWEAVEAKLEIAEAQLRDINARLEGIEKQYE